MLNRIASNLNLLRKLLLSRRGRSGRLPRRLLVGLMHAQPQAEFEAASVKPSKLGFPGSVPFTPDGGVNIRYFSLKELIQSAYNLQGF